MFLHLRTGVAAALFAAAALFSSGISGASAASPVEEREAADRRLVCVALAVYFEARGEPVLGQRAVAAVVMNRARDPRWPQDPCDVVWQRNERGCQFSWVCVKRDHEPRDMRAWERALEIAEMAVEGRLRDPTNGAVFYHGDYVSPHWRTAFRLVAVVGAHRFYR